MRKAIGEMRLIAIMIIIVSIIVMIIAIIVIIVIIVIIISRGGFRDRRHNHNVQSVLKEPIALPAPLLYINV